MKPSAENPVAVAVPCSTVGVILDGSPADEVNAHALLCGQEFSTLNELRDLVKAIAQNTTSPAVVFHLACQVDELLTAMQHEARYGAEHNGVELDPVQPAIGEWLDA